jgi:hypothetical protein
MVYTSGMRFFIALLLALSMAANAYAAASDVRLCCASEECSAAQCIDMGCLPVASPLATQSIPELAHFAAVRELPGQYTLYLPNRYKEIWTPPD